MAEYLKEHEEELQQHPIGGRAFVEPDEFVDKESDAGALFCLKSDNPNISIDPNYSIAPYYLAFVDSEGQVKIPFTKTKKLLDLFKILSLGITKTENEAYHNFMKSTNNGWQMDTYQLLLEKAVKSISGKAEEKGIESLFTRGGTNISRHSFKGLKDFEVVSYLVISPDKI